MRGRDKGHITAHHDDIAMREIEHFGDPVYHGITQCDDRVDAAQA